MPEGFRTIVITLPHFIEGEAGRIVDLLASGRVDLVDVRKPGASPKDVDELIQAVPEPYRQRVFVHDRRRSCHSLAEVMERKRGMDFVTLSPIFDSISKQGYMSAFTEEEIREAVSQGIIDSQVYALGGVTFEALPKVKEMGFGGAMILGDAWR